MDTEEDYLKDTRELIQNTFMDIVKVLDDYIPDPELKKQTFKEMEDNFNQSLGGFLQK
jgi:hypothetical protein